MRRRNSRGFTTMFVVISLMLVAAAAVALATLFAEEMRRTGRASAEGQARVLLLAGADCAGEKVRSGVREGTFAVAVPGDRGGSLGYVLRKKGEEVEAEVTSRVGGVKMAQRIVYGREGTVWVVRGVELK